MGKKLGKDPINFGGEKLYSIGQVAKMLDKTVLTVRNWADWSDEQEAAGKERFIPKPVRLGTKQTRHFKESDLPAIREFAGSVQYGQLSKYSRTKWGERGKDIKVDKSLERRESEQNGGEQNSVESVKVRD